MVNVVDGHLQSAFTGDAVERREAFIGGRRVDVDETVWRAAPSYGVSVILHHRGPDTDVLIASERT